MRGRIRFPSLAASPVLASALAAPAAPPGERLPPGVTREAVAHHSGISLSFLRSEQRAEQRVVFVHGTPGSARAWDAYLEHPAEGFEVIAVDRPGFGKTRPGGAETRLEVQAAVLEPLLHAPGRKPAILVGHSLGAGVVLEAAARQPETIAAVVIVAGALDPELEHVYWIQHLGRVPPFTWLLPRNLENSNRELIHYERELRRLAPRLMRVTAPVFILHGDRDRLVPYANAAFMKRSLENARSLQLVTIDGGSHFLPWNSRERVWELVERAAGR